ncbi:hypothetical protein BT67DRAFT_338584, partial [Trichocladium antarcticum]
MTDRAVRSARRRPFSALMKKLANLKGASSGDGGRHANSKRGSAKKRQNNPYTQSGRPGQANSPRQSHYSLSSGPSRRLASTESLERGESVRVSSDEQPPPTTGGRSVAPTLSTEHGRSRSINAISQGPSSLADTSRTAHGRRGGDSTFSSPAPSVRSLTTTLTTIQTLAQNPGGNNHNHNSNTTTTHNHHSHHSGSQVIHFNQPFPTTSPASAIPAHLAAAGPPGHPTTYATATANNLLTDNASLLTLASSSKRRRRRSFDTDASVRALAPSSLWGGSRESLPLSVLSATLDGGGPNGAGPPTPGLHRGASAGVGVGGNERTSIYSATGILAAASERNSFYAKQVGGLGVGAGGGDAASVRSGFLGHGRADSVSGSIGGLGVAGVVGSPLASPLEVGKGVEEGE